MSSFLSPRACFGPSEVFSEAISGSDFMFSKRRAIRAAAVSPERLWKSVRGPEGAPVSPSQTGLLEELARVSSFRLKR